MGATRHRSTDASAHGPSSPGPHHDAAHARGVDDLPPHRPDDAAPTPGVEPGPLLSSGTRADVYAIDDERVLRRYRSGASASGEAVIVRHVTTYGFPAPEVYWANGSDMVMQRLYGPTLLQEMVAGEVPLTEGAAMLADLHARLHQIPAPGAKAGGDVVVHLDLHPGNVILSVSHGPALVNWACARPGTPELDVAATALIVAEVVADDVGEYSQGARAFLVAFLAATEVDPRPALAEAVHHRMFESRLVPGEQPLVPVAAELVRHYADMRHAPGDGASS